MKKAIILTLVGLVLLVGILGGIKALQIRKMIAQGKSFVPPPVTVTTAKVTRDAWQKALSAVGSLSAVQGVMVAADQPGKVVEIRFAAGTRVEKGVRLVKQDISSEQAQLPGAEGELTLARADRSGPASSLPNGSSPRRSLMLPRRRSARPRRRSKTSGRRSAKDHPGPLCRSARHPFGQSRADAA